MQWFIIDIHIYHLRYYRTLLLLSCRNQYIIMIEFTLSNDNAIILHDIFCLFYTLVWLHKYIEYLCP